MVEWEAFYELEPWGCLVEDARAGEIVRFLAEKYRNKEEHKRMFEASDFFNRLEPLYTKEERDQMDLEAQIQADLNEEASHRLAVKFRDLKRLPNDGW